MTPISDRLAAVRCLRRSCARLTLRNSAQIPPAQCPVCGGNVAPVDLQRPTTVRTP